MKPKNIKARRSSFIKFLLLFMLTVTTIVGAVFFNYSVPLKENTLLKERTRNIQQEIDFQKSFALRVHNVQAMIDSLGAPGQNIAFTNTLIHGKLADLQSSIPQKDSTYLYNMYTDIVEALVGLQSTKNDLLSLENARKRIDEYKEVLDETRTELEQTKRDLDILRISRN
ncbi:hypothetical protein JJL45_12490 [Tamlana sp. s12]|uniref:type VI secretion system TssO n=1 Tax=Flavobacteriaceae TaxID=49546 RepID=UPI0007FFD8CD|nr:MULTISPECIES: type VI secretion system TssO [Tamlana]OBQ56623.1 hypothetical protein VQ01_04595 [Tamlana sp. s12]QQY81735.1 hypothetical protein JJL45_12490 [Tamlana sp. s12]